MRVTGGMVFYEDGKKSDVEYAPPRKAHVELRFDVEEGADATAMLNHTSAACIAKVNEMVGLASAPKATRARTKPAEAAPAPTEADKVAEKKAAVGIVDDSLTIEPATGVAPGAKGGHPVASAQTDLEDFTIAPAETVEVTDAELHAAARRKADDLKDPVPVRKLVDDMNPDKTKAFPITNIPQAQRGEFLKRLSALSK